MLCSGEATHCGVGAVAVERNVSLQPPLRRPLQLLGSRPAAVPRAVGVEVDPLRCSSAGCNRVKAFMSKPYEGA